MTVLHTSNGKILRGFMLHLCLSFKYVLLSSDYYVQFLITLCTYSHRTCSVYVLFVELSTSLLSTQYVVVLITRLPEEGGGGGGVVVCARD